MAYRAPHPCNWPLCPHTTARRYCATHERQVTASYNAARGSSTAQGYGARWQRESKGFLLENPTCIDCGAPATQVDHEIPHRGDPELFWNRDLWRARCASDHSRKTARQDGRWGRSSSRASTAGTSA
jgi:5-methylcytosine-specific restriction protein A